MKSHQFDVHEYVNPLRLRLYGTCCLSCNTEFHSRHRLYRHLAHPRNEHKCAKFYVEQIEPVEFQTYRELQRLERKALVPHGKLLQPPSIKLGPIDGDPPA